MLQDSVWVQGAQGAPKDSQGEGAGSKVFWKLCRQRLGAYRAVVTG